MDTLRIIAELREECARLDEAILSLKKLTLLHKPRRGRPGADGKRATLAAPESSTAGSAPRRTPSRLPPSHN